MACIEDFRGISDSERDVQQEFAAKAMHRQAKAVSGESPDASEGPETAPCDEAAFRYSQFLGEPLVHNWSVARTVD